VALALIVGGALLRVEVVHPDCIEANCTSKEVPTIAEFDLTTTFDLECT
jgi:hypothetical protein